MSQMSELRNMMMQCIRDTCSPEALINVLLDCAEERAKQDSRWGDQSGKHLGAWFSILAEEFGEVAKEVCELTHAPPGIGRVPIGQNLRDELVQTMAVCAAFIEAGDRKGWSDWPYEMHLKREGGE